jgi:phage gp45-like
MKRPILPSSDPNSLLNRLYGLFRMARVTLFNEGATPRQIQVVTATGETEDEIPHYQPAGLRSKPTKGQAVLISRGGHRRNSMCILVDMGIAGEDYLQAGDVSLDDYRRLKIWLSATGIIVDGGGLPVTFTNASKIRAECPIESTGEITAMVDGAAVPLSTHLTTGIQRGSARSDGPVHP